ncbi:DUF202 domain-containing protein [Vibrio gelatinilyticus]|uniref:DUF202 domain-containing protein n=1 Tax=Vibrio gelatinilyticus TaxID=2893468 RepID=UPI003CC6C161
MVRDPGLQLERTVLAWFRTMWLSLLLSVVMIKYGITEQDPSLLFGATSSVVLSLLLLGSGHWRAKKFRYESHQTSGYEVMIKKGIVFLVFLVGLLNFLQLVQVFLPSSISM